MTLFFDDDDHQQQQQSVTSPFLAFVIPDLAVVVMTRSHHARLISVAPCPSAYLCDERDGRIEREIRFQGKSVRANSNLSRRTPLNGQDDEDDDDDGTGVASPLSGSTIQIQLNSSMQIEYFHLTNIRFGLSVAKEDLHLQFGSRLERRSINVSRASARHGGLSTIVSNSSHSNDIDRSSDRHDAFSGKASNDQISLHDLPMIHELLQSRKRIRLLLDNWLATCRTALGRRDTLHLLYFSSRSSRRHGHEVLLSARHSVVVFVTLLVLRSETDDRAEFQPPSNAEGSFCGLPSERIDPESKESTGKW